MLSVNWHLDVSIWDEDKEEYIESVPDDVAEIIAKQIIDDYVSGHFDIDIEV